MLSIRGLQQPSLNLANLTTSHNEKGDKFSYTIFIRKAHLGSSQQIKH